MTAETDHADLTRIEAHFSMDRDEESYDEPSEGPKLTRVTIRKEYEGEIVGRGLVHVLTAQGPDGGGYVASERIVGSLRGRRGSFVIQHGGLADQDGQSTFGSIVPGSGTGGLAGIRGQAFEAEEGVLTLAYALSSD